MADEEREMTLDEWIEPLAETHNARQLVEQMRALARLSVALDAKFIPKLNIKDSALDADAITAWNEWGIAVEQLKASHAGKQFMEKADG